MANASDYKQIVPSGSHDPFDRIPAEINEMILAHLSIPDLLSCGLVNKLWKNRSRSYLQNHRECFAYIKIPCKDLLALNNEMSRYDLSMINGIHIRNENPGKWADVDVVHCCQALMQFPLKYLYVDMRLEDETKSDVQLVKALIRATRLSLNKLTVRFYLMDLTKTNFFDFLLAAGERNTFPELTVFESLGRFFPCNSNWDRVLPAIAPKLQNIFGAVTIHSFTVLDASVVKCIRDVFMSSTDFGLERSRIPAEYSSQIPAAHLSNLRTFEIQCHSDYTTDDHRSSVKVLWDILHKNRNTLEKIEICPFDLLEYLKHYPNVRFPKLTALELIDHDEFEVIAYTNQAIFQHVNTPKLFPSLKEVKVHMEWLRFWETELHSIEEGICDNQEPLVLELRKYDDLLDEMSIFGKLLQRVTTLHIEVIRLGFRNSFGLADAFLGCPLMDELIVEAQDGDQDLQDILYGTEDHVMDAFLCGIHVDEVTHVLEQHRSGTLHLQHLNIVPVRPPITFAPNLKRLCLRDVPGYHKDNPRRLTEVSGYLAFCRMPQVEVKIEIDIKYRHEYTNLTPFANITYMDENDILALY